MRDLSKIVEVLKDYDMDADSIYPCFGIDYKELIYDEDGVQLYYCAGYLYMDVIGLSKEEFKELKRLLSE